MRKYIIEPKYKTTILSALKDMGIVLTADCGGKGTCGKCTVVVDGRKCLACKTIIETRTEVEIPSESRLDSIYIESIASEATDNIKISKKVAGSRSFFMCADIGTTTIAAVLIDEDGKIVVSDGTTNSQRSFGADVISRVEAAESGKLNALKKLVRDDIKKLKRALARKANICEEQIDKIIISANTVMEHLFMGYSVSGFAKAPYKAITLDTIYDEKIELLPGLSPFVGADILSGIAYCEIDKSEGVVALIDLGTNGEMALGSKAGIKIASTAAGPVFEGGGIVCGTTAKNGAVSDVEISGMRVFSKTINDTEANGICGTGLISIVSELKKNGIIDVNGIFIEEYIEDGFPITSDIYITKDDIRNFLMAKSAIRAGLCTLCKSMSIEFEDIDKLYIAGGFGKHLNIEKAAEIGLIPEEVKDKCVLVGNTSLRGSLMRATGKLDDERIARIKVICDEIVLAENGYFQQEYINNMRL